MDTGSKNSEIVLH